MKLSLAAAAISATLCLSSYATAHEDHEHHDHHAEHQHDEHGHEHHDHAHHDHDHDHDHDHHQHSAHVHGEGQLTLIQEDNQVMVQLQIPTDSLWGFERAPESEAESQMIYKVLRQLEQGHSYFNFEKNKQCEPDSSQILANETSGSHQEVQVQWSWHCQDTVTWLESTLFQHYKIHKLSLQWLNQNGNGGATLTPTNPAAHW